MSEATKPGALCKAAHPTAEEVFCTRLKDHNDRHAAYVFSMRQPETWDDSDMPQPEEDPLADVVDLDDRRT